MTIPLQMAPKDLLWQVTRNESPMPAEQRDAILADPPFGSVFTDHMVDICWSEMGWMAPAAGPALRPHPNGPGCGRVALRPGNL